jgi:hypothetical protein
MTADLSLPVLLSASITVMLIAIAAALFARSIHTGLIALALVQAALVGLSLALGALDLAVSIAAMGLGAAAFALAAPSQPRDERRARPFLGTLLGLGLLAAAIPAFAAAAPFRLPPLAGATEFGPEALAIIGAALAVVIAAPALRPVSHQPPHPPGPLRPLAAISLGLAVAVMLGPAMGASGVAVGAILASGALLYALAIGPDAIARAMPGRFLIGLGIGGLLSAAFAVLAPAPWAQAWPWLDQGVGMAICAALLAVGLPAIADRPREAPTP